MSTSNDTLQGVPDDFHGAPLGENEQQRAERRLHLQAFDYWHALKADRAFPLFSELRAEDLAPFKTHSLLVEFNQNGTVVRFLGDEVAKVVDAPLKVGGYLADHPTSSFARALLEQFSDEDARARAAEFEFIEDHLTCRGMMLPFSRDGSGAHFVMVVASFRIKTPELEAAPEALPEIAPELAPDAAPSRGSEDPLETPQDTGVLQDAKVLQDAGVSQDIGILNGLVSAGQRAAETVVHMDNGNRTSLYGALAAALALYESAQENPNAYAALLQEAGLRTQARAPFTPALKLVFGAQYDKTRLTEYAAAIAYAVRQGKTSASLLEFLNTIPGGIKGCVHKERMLKRREAGTPAHSRQQEAEATLKSAPKVALKNLDTLEDTDGDFCLVLARKRDGGGLEALGCPDISKATLDTAVRQIAANLKKMTD